MTAGAVNLADALIETAEYESTLNVREIGGKNRGPKVQEYQRSVGLGVGGAWCAAFVAWCVMRSRQLEKPPSWCSASVVTMFHKARRKVAPAALVLPIEPDYKSRVVAGMIWCRAKNESGAKLARSGTWVLGHCGIVVEVTAEAFYTVEGNTNSAGSRDGDGVYRKEHRWSSLPDIQRTIGWFSPNDI